jgi:dienelactone hydrolase
VEKKKNNGLVYGTLAWLVVVAGAMASCSSFRLTSGPHTVESSVRIPSADKQAGKIHATLYKPTGGSGPFPAVILMHPGGGVRGWLTDFGATISGWGYVTLVIDTYGTRNIRGTTEIGYKKGAFHQISDIYGGYRFLSKLKIVDPKRIAALGFSRGGHTALNAIGDQRSLPDYLGKGLAKPGDFTAAVAIYPHCVDQEKIAHKAPVLILIGDRDRKHNLDCSAEVVKRGKASGLQSALHIYPGVTHSYFARRARNPSWEKNFAAADDTERRTKAFLAKFLH